MFPEHIKELLGIGDLGLKDYELAKKLKEARKKKQEEVEFVLEDGGTIKIKLNYSSSDGIIGSDVWGW